MRWLPPPLFVKLEAASVDSSSVPALDDELRVGVLVGVVVGVVKVGIGMVGGLEKLVGSVGLGGVGILSVNPAADVPLTKPIVRAMPAKK